jgi:hypothetical protein
MIALFTGLWLGAIWAFSTRVYANWGTHNVIFPALVLSALLTPGVILTYGFAIAGDKHPQEIKTASTMVMPGFNSDPVSVRGTKKGWNKLMKQCPGINKYNNDLQVLSAHATKIAADAKQIDSVEFEFKVADKPSGALVLYHAMGHHCRFNLFNNQTMIKIQKDACVSLCLDRPYESSSDYVAKLD